MGIARTWVFPILRLIVLVAIGAALVKLAFFADTADTAAPEFPTGEIIEPQIPVTLGTISNDIVLEGSIAPAPAISVVPSLSGEVRSVSVKDGDTVKKGQELAQVRALVVNSDGSSGGTRWLVLEATSSGVVSGSTLFFGESVAAGTAVAKITPATFEVSATIPPEQLYRLVEEPTEASVAINGGPAPFACTGLTILVPTAGDGAGEAGSTTTVRCTVPKDVRVFAGLTAQMTIAGGVAENVLTLPMTSVLGAAEAGIVYVVLPDGTTEERAVTLGLNDGISVEIIDGVVEGELVLQFVPGAPGGDGIPIDGGFIGEGGDCRPVLDPETGEVIGEDC
ncbi:efflux RND transporter periplasmic adaptor subunit [uncultured Schumannella sp.]|uniref:efflux RND transporter periplasmic adaptor subunit n=1 Tax=uncultured Schumannella sp. TaxID=1195956 RepID=UPI0025EA78AC|nr:biotin/lipoyl-binding protein [uncultured Schumannella sp.]